MPSDREPMSRSLTRGPALAGQLSIQRLHRIRVPVAGPREAEAGWPRPKSCLLLWLHDGLLAPLERGAIDPHAVQNRRQLAGQGDLGTFQAAPLGHIEGPAL